MHRGLGRGVAAANQVDVIAYTKRGFARTSAVVNAGSYKSFFIGKAKPVISDASGTNRSARYDFRSVCEIDHAFVGKKLAADSLTGKQHLRTEAARLFASSLG